MITKIEDYVHKIIKDKLEDSCDFSNDDVLQEIGIDSMKIIGIVMMIEEKYNFEFEPDKLSYKTLRSVSSISKYINQRIKDTMDQ